MSNTRNDIPNPNAPNFNQRMRETLMTYLGRQGDPLNRGVTVRDLVKNGVAALPDGYTLRPGAETVPLLPVATGKKQEIDLTPPPQPTGFAVAPAVNHVFIEHDGPSYSQGGGHLRTRVYGTTVSPGDPLPVFGNAVEITQFFGTVHAHPSNPATTWHLWIKWESKAGVLSASPAGGTNGLKVTTAYDAEQLIKALTGQITDSHLYRTLTDEESMSDAVGRLRGTITAHKAAQETLNASATVAESVNVEVDALKGSLAQKVAVLESKFGSNVAALQQSFETTADALGYVGTQYTVKTALTSNGTTVVGGFGLVGTSNEDAPPTIDFGVVANKFFVAAPATHDLPGVVPFAVVTTATSDGDGGTIPPGVYIEGAYIKGGSISGAAIKGGTITGSKLIDVSADKLTAGSLQVGEYIQSATSYDYGSGIEPVWKIDGNGNAKFNNATVRGTVYATNGQFWGTLLGGAATAFNSGLGFYAGGGSTGDGTNYRWRVGNPTGARIQWNGSAVEVYNASNQLALSSGGITASQVSGLGSLATQNDVSTSQVSGLGSLATQDSVSTSQVTGLGSLATQDSVNWNTQLLNVPAFGNFAYLSSITSANISTYIAGAAIGTAYIADAAITQAKIGSAAVGSAQIADASITQAKIANLAVGSAQISDAAITNAKITNAAIDTLKIADQSVTISNSSSGVNPSTNITVPSGQTMRITSHAYMPSYATGGTPSNATMIHTLNGVSSTEIGVSYGSGTFRTNYISSVKYAEVTGPATVTASVSIDSAGISSIVTIFGAMR